MSEWQKIETAPRDGSLVLVVVKGGHGIGGDHIALANLWFHSDGSLGGGAHGFNGGWDYIYWMPLPDIPK